MAVSKISSLIKYKDFTNVSTDSNGFVNTGVVGVPIGATNRTGDINTTTQVQFTVDQASSQTPNFIGVRFMNWSGANAQTGTISFRLLYIEIPN